MSSISIQAASSAGRPSGRDGIWVCPDLSRPAAETGNDDRGYNLSAYGALMAAACGNGAAGEAAAQSVIASLKGSFALIPSAVTRNDGAIRQFVSDAFAKAAQAVKAYAEAHTDLPGSASASLALAWVIGGKAYVAWAGDARAWRINRANGIAALTSDRAVANSLGADVESPRCAIERYDLHDGDLLMLCAEPCNKQSDNEIEKLIMPASMAMPLASLLAAVEKNGCGDAAAALMRVRCSHSPAPAMPIGWRSLHADEEPADDETAEAAAQPAATDVEPILAAADEEPDARPATSSGAQPKRKKLIVPLLILAAAAAAAVILAIGAYRLLSDRGAGELQPEEPEKSAIAPEQGEQPEDLLGPEAQEQPAPDEASQPEAAPEDTAPEDTPSTQTASPQTAQQPAAAQQSAESAAAAPTAAAAAHNAQPSTSASEVQTQGAAKYRNISIPSSAGEDE